MGKKINTSQLKLAKRITRNVTIPSQPKVMLELSRLSERHDPDWRSLSHLIRRDMALAAAVLQEANSNQSKKQNRTASVEKAIIMLGWQDTKKLLEEMFYSHSLTSKNKLSNEIREQGATNAETAMWLVRQITNISPHFRTGYYPLLSLDQTYISALFLNCGMIAMENNFSDYAEFLQQIRKNRDHNLIKAENDIYGTNHALSGYLMAKELLLPKPVCDIILDHHKAEIFNQPGQKIKNLSFTVLHGVILVLGHLSGEISHMEWELMEDKILDFFNITHKDIEELAESLKTKNLEMAH
jgi:HD-like signal output (HDOD) protein